MSRECDKINYRYDKQSKICRCDTNPPFDLKLLVIHPDVIKMAPLFAPRQIKEDNQLKVESEISIQHSWENLDIVNSRIDNQQCDKIKRLRACCDAIFQKCIKMWVKLYYM